MVSRLPAKGPVAGAGVGACAAALPATSSASSAMASCLIPSLPFSRSSGLFLFRLGERLLQRRGGRRYVPDRLDALALDARAMRLDIQQGGAARAIIFDIARHGTAATGRRQLGERILVDRGMDAGELVVAVGGAEVLVAAAASDTQSPACRDDVETFMDAEHGTAMRLGPAFGGRADRLGSGQALLAHLLAPGCGRLLVDRIARQHHAIDLGGEFARHGMRQHILQNAPGIAVERIAIARAD